MILLDTGVICELVRPVPEPAVVAYVRALAPEAAFTAAICEAEVSHGLARLPAGPQRDELAARIATLFAHGFRNQILVFDSLCARHYGAIRAAGRPIRVEDAMIAATACAYGATVATRDAEAFEGCGVETVNPWRAA